MNIIRNTIIRKALINNSIIQGRRYHEKVLDHYNNPRNVGTLDKEDKNVGTGLVGAPACIHKDTKIAVSDGRRIMTVEDLYLENKIVQVWSYNINKHIYEIKDAIIIKNSIKKPMKKIIFDDDSFLICTDDHKFLLKNNKYLEVNNIKKTDSIVPFKRSISKIGYWEDFVNKCSYNHKIKEIENLDNVFDCYDIQVEENNNFAVITKETQDIHSGIIIHNCGDVMKLQIKVDDDGKIIDAKFKTFGCGSAISSSSYVTTLLKDKHIDAAINIKNIEIAKELNLPPVKLHCSMLAEDAVKAAINDYKSKQKIVNDLSKAECCGDGCVSCIAN